MKTIEERNKLISKMVNEWFDARPQPGIGDLVIDIIEALEASSYIRTLSDVATIEPNHLYLAMKEVETIKEQIGSVAVLCADDVTSKLLARITAKLDDVGRRYVG